MSPSLLSVLADNSRGPEYVEHVVDSLHSGVQTGWKIKIRFTQHKDAVSLFCLFPRPLQPVLRGGLHAFYPTTEVIPLDESALKALDTVGGEAARM